MLWISIGAPNVRRVLIADEQGAVFDPACFALLRDTAIVFKRSTTPTLNNAES
jgi:hypothetical protein